MGNPTSLSQIVVEVEEHPDHRQIATFFLGWVFVTSVQCLLSSGLHTSIYRRVRGSSSSAFDAEKAPSGTSSTHTIRTINPALLFAFSLCFLFASVGYLVSLSSFGPKGETGCAFAVAAGGLATQFARLVGLSIILVALRQLGIGRRETLIYCSWLLAGLALVFANFAIGTGSISKSDKLNVFLCDRKHVLGLSLASSFMYSLIEVWAIGRILTLTFGQSRHVFVWLGDFRVRQAFSLLLLELLTMVPSALFTGILGEFIPFSLGAVIVLITFQQRHQVPSPAVATTVTQGPSDAAALRDLYLARLASRYTPSIRSYRTLSSGRRSVQHSIKYPQPIIGHPYSAKNLDNTSVVEVDKWASGYGAMRTSRRSSRTIDSRSVRSIGVVEVARRARYPWTRPSSYRTEEVPALPPFESTASLVRARLMMVEGSNKFTGEDLKPDTPFTADLAVPDLALDPRSHFSMSSTSPSMYPISDASVDPTPSKASSRVQSSDAFPPLPMSPKTPTPAESVQSLARMVSVATMSIAGSNRHSLSSLTEPDLNAQIVTIMPPTPSRPILLTPMPRRPVSDNAPRQFRAAGYANPIPVPKLRRDMMGDSRVPEVRRADVPHSVASDPSDS